MEAHKIAEVLSSTMPFWDGLAAADKELLVSAARERHFAAGEQIDGCGANCLGGFVILEGSVRIYLMSEEGREVTLIRVRPGEPCLMGASCVLHSMAFDVSMEAEGETDCIVIAPGALDAVYSHDLRAENWSLNSIVDKFSDILWSLQQALFSSFDKRLATFLYEESTRSNSDTVEMTQEQIAKHLGSAREVVSRMLSYFSGLDLVAVKRGRIEILDREGLRKIALS